MKEKFKTYIIQIVTLIFASIAAIIAQDVMQRIQKLENRIEGIIQDREVE